MDKSISDKIIQNSKQYMEEGYSCSESILLAVGPHYLDNVDPLALRMATPFAGGLGGTHAELCGALVGGVMLIGALHGRSDAQTNSDHCKELAAAFREKFLEEFGSLNCQYLKDHWVKEEGQESCAILVARTCPLLINTLENK
jgi:C_GCAxxG_C_C family probable redox protein